MEDIVTNDVTVYTTYSNANMDAAYAAAGAGMLMMFFAFIIFYVVQSIFMMQLFKKANVASWKAWVPIVNVWTFLQIGGQKGWWVFAGVAGLIIGYIFFAIAAATGAMGDITKIGVDFAIGSTAVIGYLAILAGAVLMFVFQIIAAYNIGKKLGWGGGMLVIFIFFQLIWLGIAGLGKTKYDNKKGQPSLAKTV